MRNAGMGSYLSCQYSLSEYHKTDLKGTAVCSAIQRVGIYLLNFWVQENMAFAGGVSTATNTSWDLYETGD